MLTKSLQFWFSVLIVVLMLVLDMYFQIPWKGLGYGIATGFVLSGCLALIPDGRGFFALQTRMSFVLYVMLLALVLGILKVSILPVPEAFRAIYFPSGQILAHLMTWLYVRELPTGTTPIGAIKPVLEPVVQSIGLRWPDDIE